MINHHLFAAIFMIAAFFMPAVSLAQQGTIKSLQAEPDTWPAGTWNTYKSKYMMPGGRIIDDGNGGISHSEGQGYGMLLAVMANDPGAFSTIWNWTRKELMTRPDGLTSWRWEAGKSPNITDPNNASDGDLLIAWALAEAAERWGKPDFAKEAGRIATAVDRVNGARSPFGRIHMPGAVGFSAESRPDGPVVNLSYWLFPAYATLKKTAPSVDWEGYRASGLTLLRAARFGLDNLPSDWISIRNAKAAPAEDFPPVFSYNAIRIPLYLAWGGGSTDSLAPFVAYGRKSGARLREYNVKTSEPGDPMGDAGYLAVFALAACATNLEKFPGSLRSVSFDRYYSSTLHMLALAAARLGYSKCL